MVARTVRDLPITSRNAPIFHERTSALSCSGKARGTTFTQWGRTDDDDNDLARRHSVLFHDLREKVRAFGSGTLQFTTKAHNYNASTVRTLGNNLYHTGIDIVLESGDYLFVGEAKHKSDPGTDGSANLVH